MKIYILFLFSWSWICANVLPGWVYSLVKSPTPTDYKQCYLQSVISSLSLSLSHRLNRLQNLSLTIAALLDNTKPISPPHGMRGGRGRGGGEAAKYFIFWPGSNWENISLTDTQNFIESFCYPNLYEKTEEPVRWGVWLLLCYSETAIFRLQTTLQYSPCVHTSLCCSGFLCGLWGRLGGGGSLEDTMWHISM